MRRAWRVFALASAACAVALATACSAAPPAGDGLPCAEATDCDGKFAFR